MLRTGLRLVQLFLVRYGYACKINNEIVLQNWTAVNMYIFPVCRTQLMGPKRRQTKRGAPGSLTLLLCSHYAVVACKIKP